MAVPKFFRKYGKQDYLKMKFNPDTRQYEFYYGIELIPYRKLDKEYKQIFKDKNNELKTNPNLVTYEFQKLEHDKKVIERYNKLKSMGYSCSSTTVYSDLPTSPIPNYFSNQLDNMLQEDNVLYGIHRTGYLNEAYLTDILQNGLIMTGHGLNISQPTIELNQNIAYYPDNMEIKSQLLNAHGYKQSNGSLLIRIPDNDLARGDLYIQRENDVPRLNPKYIVGYVPLVIGPNNTLTVDRIITLRDLTQNNVQTNYEEQYQNYEQPYFEEAKHR